MPSFIEPDAMDTKVTEKGRNFQAVNGIREVAAKFQDGVKLGELMTKNSFCYTSQIFSFLFVRIHDISLTKDSTG